MQKRARSIPPQQEAAGWERFRNLLIQEHARVACEAHSILPDLGRGERLSDEDQIRAAHDEFVAIEGHRIKRRKLRLIEEALSRIGDGTYDVCQSCEGRISVRRLSAVPWARLCIHCEERAAGGDVSDASLEWSRIDY